MSKKRTEAEVWRSMLGRIRVHGASGLWTGEDCAIGAVAALEGGDAGRAFMLQREAARGAVSGTEPDTAKLVDLLTEATRQDFGTPGWRKRARNALAAFSVDAGNPESEDYEAATTYQDALAAACGTEADSPARSSQGEDHDPGVMYERQMRHIELLRQQRDEARAEIERLRGTEPDTAKLLGKIADKAKYLAEGAWDARGTRLVGEQIHRWASDALAEFSVDAEKPEGER